MKSSKLNPYFTVVPGSGFSEYKNVVTGETVATMQEANAKNDQIVNTEKLFENILPLKNNRMTPTKSRKALKVTRSVNPMVFYNTAGIDELIKVRQEIADMKVISESDANEFKNKFVQRIEPDSLKGLGSLEVEHDDF
tara:strand:+ start:918 stop:1331 length:414 start_codon:yes stop_codon:yes gene_type:complete